MDRCFLSHFLLCMELWGKTKFCVDHTVFFHFRKDKINSFFQCLFCLKKGKRQVKAFQKIIEIFAGIRYRKERKKLFICCSRKLYLELFRNEDPYSEDIAAMLITAYGRLGDYKNANRVYKEYEDLYLREFEEKPGPEVRKAFEGCRKKW